MTDEDLFHCGRQCPNGKPIPVTSDFVLLAVDYGLAFPVFSA